MQKYNPRLRTLSSSSKETQSVITPQKSLSKLKVKLKSDHAPFGTISYNESVKDEYMGNRNSGNNIRNAKKQEPKTTDYKKRRKESLDLINRDIMFENQLKDQIKQLNQTLVECQNLQKQLIQQRNFQTTKSKSKIFTNKIKRLSSFEQKLLLSFQNIKQLVYLEQMIKNREKQITQVTDEIAELKQQHWDIHIRKIPLEEKAVSTNFNLNKFILADQMNQLNQQLKSKILLYQKKYNDLMMMKVKINHAYKDSEYFYQMRVKNAQKSNSLFLTEKPFTYAQFKQNFLQKKKQAQKQKTNLQRVKSHESMLIAGINQYSNISNVSAILPRNFIDSLMNHELLPGQIPQLPKQLNPTMKSMNLKKQVLKQAIETRKNRHEKEVTELIDKLLFLHDEDAFLTEEMQKLHEEICSLDQRFSWIEMKTRQPTTISKSPSFQVKKKLSYQGSKIEFNNKNHNKNYIDENLLLDNTGNNSTLLDQTGKSFGLA